LAFFAAVGVILSKRIVHSAFSLGFLLLAIAGIYGSLSLQAAFLTQLVLYIGGVMVLVGFALQLYPEPSSEPSFKSARESAGKGLFLLIIMAFCLYLAPWSGLINNGLHHNQAVIVPENSDLKAVGRQLLLGFPFEFEWLGILMLAGILVTGWFLKEMYLTKTQR
jgi:NADH:ubiquinone oxidoreductase subunit 6 (subunit J)